MSNAILLVTISIVFLTFVIFAGAALLPLLDPCTSQQQQPGAGLSCTPEAQAD
jgi:hypothetical protein